MSVCHIGPSVYTSIDSRSRARIRVHVPIPYPASMGSLISRTHLHVSRIVVVTVLRVVAGCGEEVDEEGDDPKGKDQSHNPFENGAGLGSASKVAGDKGDGEDDCRRRIRISLHEPQVALANPTRWIFGPLLSVVRSGRRRNSPSTIIKESLTQNEMRSMRLLRKRIPRRWYSAQMKIAEIMYPPLYEWLVSVEIDCEGWGRSIQEQE